MTTPRSKVQKLMKKFSIAKVSEPVKFMIDEDEFEAVSPVRLPAGILGKYFEQINNGDLFVANEAFFEAVLTEDSFKVFKDRLSSRESPINIKVLGEVAAWLLAEVYMGEAGGES